MNNQVQRRHEVWKIHNDWKVSEETLQRIAKQMPWANLSLIIPHKRFSGSKQWTES